MPFSEYSREEAVLHATEIIRNGFAIDLVLKICDTLPGVDRFLAGFKSLDNVCSFESFVTGYELCKTTVGSEEDCLKVIEKNHDYIFSGFVDSLKKYFGLHKSLHSKIMCTVKILRLMRRSTNAQIYHHVFEKCVEKCEFMSVILKIQEMSKIYKSILNDMDAAYDVFASDANKHYDDFSDTVGENSDNILKRICESMGYNVAINEK